MFINFLLPVLGEPYVKQPLANVPKRDAAIVAAAAPSGVGAAAHVERGGGWPPVARLQRQRAPRRAFMRAREADAARGTVGRRAGQL